MDEEEVDEYQGKEKNPSRERHSLIDYEPLYLQLRSQLKTQSESKGLISFDEIQKLITFPPEQTESPDKKKKEEPSFPYGNELVKFLSFLNVSEKNLNDVRSFLETIGFYSKDEKLETSKFDGEIFRTILRFFCPLIREGEEKPKTICYKLSEIGQIFNFGWFGLGKAYELVAALMERTEFRYFGCFMVRISSQNPRCFTIHTDSNAYRLVVNQDPTDGSEYYSFEDGEERFYTMMETLQFCSKPNSYMQKINLNFLIGNMTDLKLDEKPIGQGNCSFVHKAHRRTEVYAGKAFRFFTKKQNFLGEFWEEVWKTVAAKSLSQSTLFVKYNGIYRQPETKEKYLVIELLYTDLQNYNAQLESDIQEFITEPQEQRLQELDNLKFRLQILKTIAAGVKLLHNDLRIIHRDLALRNVMLRRSLQPVLIDLGYSVFEHDKYKSLPFPIYTSAPELIEENKPEFASDIFSFGCLTVELLCCKSISKFINEDEKKKKIKPNIPIWILYKTTHDAFKEKIQNREGDGKPIDTWTDDIAKWFLEFIKGCTKKEPQERLEWDKIIQQLDQKIDAVGKEYERMLNSMQDISAN